jgi:YD repeat-containing protein
LVDGAGQNSLRQRRHHHQHLFATRGWLDHARSEHAGCTVLLNQVYTRDAAGRIIDVANVAREDWSYSYDDLDRLTRADNLNDDELDQVFRYDDGGNITLASGIGAYVYPAGTAPRPHAPISIGSQPIT